jgi:hypothetical protein
LDHREIDIPQAWPQAVDRPADKPALDAESFLQEGIPAKSNPTLSLLEHAISSGLFQDIFQNGIIFLDHISQPPYSLAQARMFFFEKWDYLVAECIPVKTHILVGRILDGLQPVKRQVIQHIVPPGAKQRADQGDPVAPGVGHAAEGHPAQASRSGAPKQVHQDAFNLIIGIVRHCHGPRFPTFRLCKKETITQVAGGFFDRQSFPVRLCPDVSLSGDKLQA